MPEFREIATAPDGFMRLCELLDGMRSPLQVVRALGMGEHHSVLSATSNWDRIYRQIVYRADLYTLYQQPLPPIEIRPDGGCGPGPLAIADGVDGPDMEGVVAGGPGDGGAAAGHEDPGEGEVCANNVPEIPGVGFYESVRQDEAVKFLVSQLASGNTTNRQMFSATMDGGSIRSLQSRLALSADLEAAPEIEDPLPDDDGAAGPGPVAVQDVVARILAGPVRSMLPHQAPSTNHKYVI
jgi:hypothetical protein